MRQAAPHSRSVLRWLLLILLSIAWSTAQAARAPQWTVIDAGTLGNDGAIPRAINNKGDIVGQSRKPDPTSPVFSEWHAFLWQNGMMLDLGVPAGSRSTMAFDVNDHGDVLAQDELGRSFVWEDGAWTAVPFAGGGKRMNKAGDIAGNYALGSNVHAFLWRNGVFFDLGTLGGFSSAEGMNDKSIVVGTSAMPAPPFTPPPLHAFVHDGTMHDIGTLGGRDSVATDVNNHGIVVGAAMDASNTFRAFIWDDRGGMRPLLSVAGDSSAQGINDHGAIVGRLQNRGFLFDDGVLTMLDSLDAVRAAGFSQVFPSGINDRGWITASAVKPGDFRSHAIVLIPKG